MKHRSILSSSPGCYILLTLLVMALDSLVFSQGAAATAAAAGGGPSRTVQIPISTVVAPLDAAAMETLCADQIGMCTVSCQNKIQQNSCDAKTLSWTCACKNGTRSTFGDWQLPVSFQLCRRQLSSCLQQCESLQQQMLDREQKARVSTSLRKRETDSGGSRDDIEQEQETESIDIEDAFQLARYSARLQAASFSRHGNYRRQRKQQQRQRHTVQSKQQRRKKSKKARKKRALEQPASTKIQHQSSLSKARGTTGTSTEIAEVTATKRKNEVLVQPPSAYSLDSPVPRDPICASQCEHQFSCGTRSAPKYHNLNDYLASNNSPNSDGDGRVKSVSRIRTSGPDSGGLFKLRLSMLVSVAVAMVSVVVAHHVTL